MKTTINLYDFIHPFDDTFKYNFVSDIEPIEIPRSKIINRFDSNFRYEFMLECYVLRIISDVSDADILTLTKLWLNRILLTPIDNKLRPIATSARLKVINILSWIYYETVYGDDEWYIRIARDKMYKYVFKEYPMV